MDKYAFGRNLRKILDERKLSQHWLAEQMGSKDSIFTPWMNGKHLPSVIKLYEISKILGVSMNELLDGIKMESGAKMNQSNKTCDCYRNGRCVGTKEIDSCSCGGNKSKCDFYEHVRWEGATNA